MSLSRRHFLRLLASGAAGLYASQELDLDRLLWVPGERTIFLPPTNPTVSLAEIVALEWERILPKVATLFERDDTFYRLLAEEMSFTKEIMVTDTRRVK